MRRTRPHVAAAGATAVRSAADGRLTAVKVVCDQQVAGTTTAVQERVETILRVAPVGDVDIVAGESLEGEIRRGMSPTTKLVVVDLRGVGLLDSMGLRVLITLRNHAKRNGHRLALVAGPAAVQRVFQLTATRGLFEWLEDPDEPLAASLPVADPRPQPRSGAQ